MDTITPITRAELRAKITGRMERRETDGSALFTLRRGLRSLELFATPDTLGGDVALDICHAVDEVERLLSQRDELAAKLGEAAYTKPTLISPAEAEKLPGGKDLVREYAFKPDNGLTGAPIDDRRQAVDVKPLPPLEERYAVVDTPKELW